MKFTLVLFSFFMASAVWAQDINSKNDIDFFLQANKKEKSSQKREYIFDESSSILVKYNPAAMVLGGALYVYQNSISYQFSATCIYHPSCSEYSKQAIAEYGVFKGVFLSADRITRCNKVAALDIHPLTVNEKTGKSKDPVKLYQNNERK
ncbi:MAG: membrane protein insertion efficiency factor YidD [Bacteroidota bacterium]